MPTLVVFWSMTDVVWTKTRLVCELTEKVAEAKYSVTTFGAFLQRGSYESVECLAYNAIMVGYEGNEALLYVPRPATKPWYTMDALRHIGYMAADPVHALVVIGRMKEID